MFPSAIWSQECTKNIATRNGCFLLPVIWQYTLVCLDDSFLLSRSRWDQIAQARQGFNLQWNVEVFLKLKMCRIVTALMTNSDMWFNWERWRLPLTLPMQRKDWKNQKNNQATLSSQPLWRFWWFEPGFLRIAALLNQKLQKGQRKDFVALRAEKASEMKELQNRLIPPPMLALLYKNGHLTIHSDACIVQIGCMLLQEQSNKTTQQILYWTQS